MTRRGGVTDAVAIAPGLAALLQVQGAEATMCADPTAYHVQTGTYATDPEEEAERGETAQHRGVPTQFQHGNPDEAYQQALKEQTINIKDIEHERLQWANLADYGGDSHMVAAENRLDPEIEADVMLLAVRAYAQWDGTYGPNQRTRYSRRHAIGDTTNRERRQRGGAG